MPPVRRPPPKTEPRPNRWAWAVAAGALLACGAAWLLWPREDKLGTVLELQNRVLAAEGGAREGDVDALVRTVDRLDRRQLGQAYGAAGAAWKGIRQEAIDGYFQAAASDRAQLLDAYIDRLTAYHALLLAMNPGAHPGSAAILPRQRRPRDAPEPTAAEREAEQTARELAERFDAAVEARAKSRGLSLPAFR